VSIDARCAVMMPARHGMALAHRKANAPQLTPQQGLAEDNFGASPAEWQAKSGSLAEGLAGIRLVLGASAQQAQRTFACPGCMVWKTKALCATVLPN
jgi:hypothetical protein